MSSVLFKLRRQALAARPWLWLVRLPAITAGLGAAALLGFLVQREMIAGNLALLILSPSLGAIALAWRASQLVDKHLTDLEQRYRDTQTSLHNRERWLQQYSRLSPGNFYILVQEPDGHIWFEFMSSAFEVIHEISVEQVLQDANIIIDSIHPEDLPTYSAAVRTSAETLATFSLQWRIQTPSGKVKWVQGNSQPQRRPNGTIAWYGVVVDITDRKQAIAELQQREAQYRAILDAIPDLIVRMHRDGTYLDIKLTDAFPLIISAEDVGRNIRDLLPAAVARQRLEAAEKVLQCGQMQVFELPLQVEGQFLWEEVRIFPLNKEEVVIIIRDLSQRRQAEIALRHSEANLRQAQRIAHVGSWEMDLQTYLITWSEEMFSIFGCSLDQLEPSYEQILAMIPPVDRDEVGKAIEQAITDHIPYRIEHRIHRPDGTQRDIVSRGEIIDDQQGLKLCGTALDITDRKQAEIALQKSEARFRQLAEAVKEGFFVFDTDTAQYSYLNPAILNLTGRPYGPLPEEPPYARGMSHWLNHIHPDDRPWVEAKLQEERHGDPFDVEYRFLHPDGRLLWLQSKAFPIEDETGNIVRIVGTVENITDRKRLEQALQDNEELFRRAFDDAPIGISLVSPEGRYLRVNKCYCDLLGYSSAELLQMHFKDITHPEDLAADMAGFNQMNEGKLPTFQMEKRYIAKDGTIIPIFLSSSCVRDANGLPLYSIGHVEDIRDRLEVERLKDEFVSIVSHELRTPITSIEGALQLLSSGVYSTRPAKAQAMLDIAIKNSNRLVRLVDDILSFERLESGKVKLMMEPCQVEELMRQGEDSVQSLADQAAVILRVNLLKATCYAAPDSIVQVLTNLLSNAIKFSNPGNKVVLEAREWVGEVGGVGGMKNAVSHSPTLPAILFSVTDRGRGIPAEKRESIFEQFQQVDVSDSRQKGGTGLGLAISKRIVEQHGGAIWVESKLGHGSTFFFTVPMSSP